jgi:hypothetical protein
MTPQNLSLFSTSLANALEQDHDILLLLLLKAAISVKDHTSEKDSGAVGQFVQRVVDLVMLSGLEVGPKFLQTTLELLLKWNGFPGGATDSPSRADVDENPTCSRINISIGNSLIKLGLADIFKCFWADWLDTE